MFEKLLWETYDAIPIIFSSDAIPIIFSYDAIPIIFSYDAIPISLLNETSLTVKVKKTKKKVVWKGK